MFEKVNPAHPDKVADRIAGAIVDLAYKNQTNPRIAVEVLIGHGHCHIIAETSVKLDETQIHEIVRRITKPEFLRDYSMTTHYYEYRQDTHLSDNQKGKIRCGDNGIFKGMPVTEEQGTLTRVAQEIYDNYKTDGKYILAAGGEKSRMIICQSHATPEEFPDELKWAEINPLGYWTGGTDVDTGATNRKLGSDMGDSVTGGGLHGKDLSKADVSVNIYAWLKAQETGKPVEISCAIGDETIDGMPYSKIVKIAHDYIDSLGGFEKFAEWGLIRFQP